MAVNDPDIATGISLEFETSGFEANITNITPPGLTRPSVQTSHQGTTAAHDFTPGDLYDPGQLEIEGFFDPDTDPPIDAAEEVVNIKYPSGTWWVFTAFMTNYTPGALNLEEAMTFSATLKVSGTVKIDVDGSGPTPTVII